MDVQFADLLAQRVAIEAEHVGCLELVAAGGCEGPCRASYARLKAIERDLRPPPSPEDVQVEYTPEQLEELRALGYL